MEQSISPSGNSSSRPWPSEMLLDCETEVSGEDNSGSAEETIGAGLTSGVDDSGAEEEANGGGSDGVSKLGGTAVTVGDWSIVVSGT